MKTLVPFTLSAAKRAALLPGLAACAFFFAAPDAHAQLGVSVTGRVAFEGIDDLTKISPAASPGLLHLTFRLTGNATAITTQDVTLHPVGSGSPYATFTATNIFPGAYDVLIKSDKNLAVVARLVVVTLSGTVPDQTLPAGDVNNDNLVDVTDFGLLVGAYNSSASDVKGTGYDSRADFNDDGLVDVTDFGLLVGNYNTTGAS